MTTATRQDEGNDAKVQALEARIKHLEYVVSVWKRRYQALRSDERVRCQMCDGKGVGALGWACYRCKGKGYKLKPAQPNGRGRG